MEVRWKTFTFYDQFLPKIKEGESCPKCFADFSYVFNLCKDPRHGVYVEKFYNLNDFVFTLWIRKYKNYEKVKPENFLWSAFTQI